MQRSAATYSAVLHCAVALGLIYLGGTESTPATSTAQPPGHTKLWNPLRSLRPAGGGQRETLPATKGRLPPPVERRTFIPPMAHILNDNPKLPLMQAILLDPNLPVSDVSLNRIGNPLGVDGPPSGGPGGPAGIGDGGCCGIGDNNGSGLDGVSRPVPASKRQMLRPVLLHKVDPEYSDEARKAKVQGTVLSLRRWTKTEEQARYASSSRWDLAWTRRLLPRRDPGDFVPLPQMVSLFHTA